MTGGKKVGTTAGPCPCGGPDYAACCGRFHAGAAQPRNAEQLMRSRYSAYVLGDAAWLRRTWHPSTCPADLEDGFAGAEAARTLWLGLTVKAHSQRDDDHAEVEFVARYKVGGKAFRLHERSRFVRESTGEAEPARWLYVDGDMIEG